MYYKKRPELMKLVEEFYRAYRALAERYDHATRALRQAHRTMAETFPDQISFAALDDSPSAFSPAELEPCTPEMPSVTHMVFSPDELQKEGSFNFMTSKRSGAYAEELDVLASKKGLKQVHEMFSSPDGVTNSKCGDSRARKGLHFGKENGKDQESKLLEQGNLSLKHENKESTLQKDKNLLDEISQLSTKVDYLNNQLKTEAQNASYFKAEAERLQEINLKLGSENNDINACHQQSLKNISDLEAEIVNLRKLNLEILNKDSELNISMQKNLRMEKEIQFLQSEICDLRRNISELSEGLEIKQGEFKKIEFSLQEKHTSLLQAQAEVESLKWLHGQSQEELKLYKQEKESSIEKLKYMEAHKQALEKEVHHDKKELKKHQMELEELRSAIENTQMQALQADIDVQAFKELYVQSVNELRIASSEMQRGLQMLETTELKKQALEEDVLQVKSENAKLSRELKEMRGEMEDLKLSMNAEHSRSLLLEETLQSLKNTYSKSQDELRLLSLDRENGVQLLRDMELGQQILKEEILQVREENTTLSMEMVQKQKELHELKTILQDKQSQFAEVEASYASMKEMHALVQEQLQNLVSEQQKEIQMRKRDELQQRISEEEIQRLREETLNKDNELELKNEELKKLKMFVEDEKLRSLQIEIALESLKKLHAETQEKFGIMLDKRESDARALENTEIQKMTLEEKIQRLEQDNDVLCLEIKQNKEEFKTFNLLIKSEQLKCEQTEVIVRSLEKLYSDSQEELRVAHEERENQLQILNNIELQGEKMKKEIQQVKVENDSRCCELKQKQEELDKLRLSLHEEKKLFQKTEASLESLKELFSESQERIKLLLEEKQNQTEILEMVNLQKYTLEEEIWKLKEENASQGEELEQIQEELNILKVRLEVEQLKSVQSEVTIESLKMSYHESQEQMRFLFEEKQKEAHILKSMEHQKQVLEKNISQVMEENNKLHTYVERKEEELDKFKYLLQEEQLHSVHKETALESLNKSYMEAKEELIFSSKEKENITLLLKDLEWKNEAMEKKILLVVQENTDINNNLVQMREELMGLHNFADNDWMFAMQVEITLSYIKDLYATSQDNLHIASVHMQEEVHILEEKNQILSKDIQQADKENQMLKNELQKNQMKLEDLKISIEIEQLLCVEFEVTVYFFKQLYSDTQEVLKSVLLERQNDVQVLESLVLKSKACEEDNQRLICECNIKQQQLEELCVLSKVEKMRSEKAEAALCSLNKLYTKSCEELNITCTEMEKTMEVLKDMEFQKEALEKEVTLVREENKNLNQVLQDKHEEIKRLCTSLQDECLRSTQGEENLRSVEALYFQAQNELKNLTLSVHQKDQILKESELRKQRAEDEIARIKKETTNLSKRNTVSLSIIKNLQGETILLKEKNIKLANELQQYEERKKAFQMEISYLKEQLNNSEENNKSIIDQLEAAGLDPKFIRSSIMTLRDENFMLKTSCMKQENEKVLLSEKLSDMQKLSERNAMLVNSLDVAEFELEGLREKLCTLEKSFMSLQESNSVLISENNSLVSKMSSLSENTREMLEKAAFFENSLQVASFELEETRGKLRCFEDMCHSLCDEKFSLQKENHILISKVESFDNSLKMLSENYAELQENFSVLQDEKDFAQRTTSKLQTLLSKEKMDKNNLLQSSRDKLAYLDHQIDLLYEESRCKDEVIMSMENDFFTLLFETVIFQSCLHDLHGFNLIISEDFHQMKKEVCREKEINCSLSEQVEKLEKELILILRSLDPNVGYFAPANCEYLSQLIMDKVRKLQDSFSELEDEKHMQLLEKTVISTLIQQIELDLVDLNLEKDSLHQHCRIADNELFLLHGEKHEILEINQQMRHELEEGYRREESLKAETETLRRLLSNLQLDNHISENTNHKLVNENKLLLTTLTNMSKEKLSLDEEFSHVLGEVAILDCLYIIFKQSSTERAYNLISVSEELNLLHKINEDLQKNLETMAETLKSIEAENLKLHNVFISRLGEYNERLIILKKDVSISGDANKFLKNQMEELRVQIEETNNLLTHRESEVSESCLQLQAMHNQNRELQQKLLGTTDELDISNAVREQLDNRVLTLTENLAKRSEVLESVIKENGCLHAALLELQSENGNLRSNEKLLASRLKKEAKCFESEFVDLVNEFHLASIHALLSEEKVLELLELLEGIMISDLVEKIAINEELSYRNSHIDKLHSKMIILEEENRMLKTDQDKWHFILSSLWRSISNMESYVHKIGMLHVFHDQETWVNNIKELGNDSSIKLSMASEVDQKLQNLASNVQKLLNCLMKNEVHADMNSKFDNCMQGTGSLKSENTTGKGRLTIVESCDLIQPNEDYRSPKSNGKDIDRGDELVMKDILLDHNSHSSRTGSGEVYSIETEEKMLELWETAELVCKGEMPQVPAIATGDDIECHLSEPEEERSECTSDIINEKELGVDSLDLPNNERSCSSHHEWKNVLEKFSFDAKRLTALRTCVLELKKKFQIFETTNPRKDAEYFNVKEQLKQVEDSTTDLFEGNEKFAKKARECSHVDDAIDVNETENMLKQRRLVLEQARRRTKKIGKLELDLQKIQYVMLKLEEEFESQRPVAVDKKTRVLLSDYLFGKKEGRRKRRHFCGCVRTKDDCYV